MMPQLKIDMTSIIIHNISGKQLLKQVIKLLRSVSENINKKTRNVKFIQDVNSDNGSDSDSSRNSNFGIFQDHNVNANKVSHMILNSLNMKLEKIKITLIPSMLKILKALSLI